MLYDEKERNMCITKNKDLIIYIIYILYIANYIEFTCSIHLKRRLAIEDSWTE